MSTIPYLIAEGKDGVEGTITFFVAGKPHLVSFDHPNFSALVEEINSPDPDVELLIELSRPITAVVNALDAVADEYLPEGRLVVTATSITFDGEPINQVLADKVMMVLRLNLDIVPWVNFLKNLYRNPFKQAREELFLFLSQANMPITEDGCFLAYKRVRGDYKDCHSGRFDNSVGQTLEMPRSEVDPDRFRTCSTGFHFCSFGYLSSFGGAHTMLVKVNPADVVSIPADHNNEKGRTWKYTVVDEVEDARLTQRLWDDSPYADVDDEYLDDDDDLWPDEYEDDEYDEPVDETDDYAVEEALDKWDPATERWTDFYARTFG